jgi:hypothetical protein
VSYSKTLTQTKVGYKFFKFSNGEPSDAKVSRWVRERAVILPPIPIPIHTPIPILWIGIGIGIVRDWDGDWDVVV